MKRRILFVDDDAHALSSLRCMVQPMEPEWDMTFAEGGEAALQALGQEAFQAVVTAMRMRGTHGGEVLAHVMTRQPSALRIALSGPADRELLARSIGCVHQALPRPCDLDQLVAMVANAAQLANQGVDADLQGILGRIEHLPSVPGLYQELSALLEGEDATVRRVGDIIRQDVGMTAKILQMVNSAFFGLRRTVEDIQDAVAFLGTDTIKALVLVHGVFDQIGELGTEKISIVDIWVHSLNVAKGPVPWPPWKASPGPSVRKLSWVACSTMWESWCSPSSFPSVTTGWWGAPWPANYR
ncbi:MAG: HDOD domain-containing protein [Holophaga sp.]|nr:HDOD domain-containing protein [Holophaga sp.]